MHADFDDEVTGLRKQVRKLRDVSFFFIYFFILNFLLIWVICFLILWLEIMKSYSWERGRRGWGICFTCWICVMTFSRAVIRPLLSFVQFRVYDIHFVNVEYIERNCTSECFSDGSWCCLVLLRNSKCWLLRNQLEVIHTVVAIRRYLKEWERCVSWSFQVFGEFWYHDSFLFQFHFLCESALFGEGSFGFWSWLVATC